MMNMLLNADVGGGMPPESNAVFDPSNPWFIIGCIAVIAIGVGVIAYIMFRTPSASAKIGDVPSIELGDIPEVPEADAETEEGETTEADDTAEAEETVAPTEQE